MMHITTHKSFLALRYAVFSFFLAMAWATLMQATTSLSKQTTNNPVIGISIGVPQKDGNRALKIPMEFASVVKKTEYKVCYTNFEISLGDLAESKKKFTPELYRQVHSLIFKNKIPNLRVLIILKSATKILANLNSVSDVLEHHGLVNNDLYNLKLSLNNKELISDLKNIPFLENEQKQILNNLDSSLRNVRPVGEGLMGQLFQLFRSYKFPFGIATNSRRVRLFGSTGVNERVMEFENIRKVQFSQDLPLNDINKTFYLEDLIRSNDSLLVKCIPLKKWWDKMIRDYPYLYEIHIDFKPFDNDVDNFYQSISKGYQQQNAIEPNKNLTSHFICKLLYSHTLDSLKGYLKEQYRLLGFDIHQKYLHLYLTSGKSKKKNRMKDMSEEKGRLVDMLTRYKISSSSRITIAYSIFYFPLLFKTFKL